MKNNRFQYKKFVKTKWPVNRKKTGLTLFYMGSKKYLNTWGGGTKFPPYIKVLKMLETWLHGMSDTSNESLEHV